MLYPFTLLKQQAFRERAQQVQREAIEYRMARERDDGLYAALARQYNAAKAELETTEALQRRLEAEQVSAEAQAPEQQAEGALSLLEDVARVTTDPAARAEVNPLLQRLGIRVGLLFGTPIKGKKREIRRLRSGLIVFGNTPLPVPLHGKDNAEDSPQGCRASARMESAASHNGEANQERQGEVVPTAASDGKDEKSRNEKQTAEVGMCPTSAVCCG